jgi:hypothetical protein
VDSREKTDRGEIDNKGKNPGDHHKFIGLGNPSRKPAAAAEEKKKKADDFPVFEPPRKVSRTTQGDAPGSSKTQSKSPAGDRRKLTSTDKKAKKTVSTSTQTLRSGSQAVSTDVQTEGPDRCENGIQTSPVKKLTGLSVTKTVTHRDDKKNRIRGRGQYVGSRVTEALVTMNQAAK